MTPSAGLFGRLVAGLLLLHAATPGAPPSHASQANPPATSVSSGRSAVSGVVTDGATGRPIDGAFVWLFDPKVSVSIGTATDSKGRFVFTDLPASARYAFRVRKSGYYNFGRGQPDAFVGPLTRIALSEREWRQHEDVVLWPFGTISGAVVDEQGEPVVGVPVHVMTRIAVGGTVQWVVGPLDATTDDRGVYRIDQLRRGTYVVHLPNVQSTVPSGTSPAIVAGIQPTVAAMGLRAVPSPFGLDLGGVWLALGHYAVPPPIDGGFRAYPPLFYSGARSPATAVPVDLADGEHKASVDFVLQPVSTFSVSGRAVGPPDALAGLVVRLFHADSPIENRNTEQGTALVAANGTFSILGVPAGRYRLSVAPISDLRLPGTGFVVTPGVLSPSSMTLGFLSSGSTPFLAVSLPGLTEYSGRTSVVVGARDVTDVVLELSAGATISGRVVKDGAPPIRDLVNVHISGTGDTTLRQVSTQVVPEAAPEVLLPRGRAPDAPPGRFLIRGVPDGDYLLSAGSATAPSLVVKSVIGPGGDYTDRPFRAIPAADIGDVIITLTDRPAGLSGVVRDRNGAIVPSAAVILFPAERSRWTHFGLNPSRIKSVVAAGPEGYKLSNLRAGGYLVVATDESQSSAWHDSRFLEAAAAVATPVTLSWGTTAVLNLTLRQVTVR